MNYADLAANDKQPAGLSLLVFTELWERFGFYTLQTIIMLYMTKALLLADHQANLLYATFSSLLYLTPIAGGYLADRYLGFQRAIIWGGVLLIVAYCVTALPGQSFFFLGLSILICANGLFKPNVSSIVGELYHKDDPRRDGGFTLFYMGINVGSLIPPLIAGAVVATYGWHAGFLVAAIGMVIGQMTFVLGKKRLGAAGLYPHSAHPKHKLGIRFYFLLISGLLGCIELCLLAFQYPAYTNYFIEAAALGILSLTFFLLFKEPLEARKKMIASLVLIIISIGFWSLYNQTFSSLMLFADRNMDKHFLGLPLDAEATQFFNPLFIIILSPLLSRLWIRLDHKQLNPSIPSKFALGVFMMSAGFLLLAGGTWLFGVEGMSSPWWLVTSYLLQTLGELLISPIGLAMITVLCPKHLVGMMMGVWFFSQAAAFAIGGTLANIAEVPANISAVHSLPIYSHAFFVYGMLSLIFAIISGLLVPVLKRLIAGNTEH